ncbi:hypothetical protein [Anaerotruncus colihominis]|uniref:hypothetical protein n=2 Tax=Anaerotruncus colihominis TaxID=169435 RepID=UPI00189DAA69|nr:hypothetical protein [Anaerotruncus colihominis]MBS4987777.1 hypothetical protein [Anaerotruncus colihominis]
MDTIGISADGIGLFRFFSPRISQVKQKIQTGVSQKLAGFEPPNSLEIYSALFETEFFKKGAIFISSKNQSAKGVNFSANRLKDWHLFLFRKRAPLKMAAWISESANINATISIRNFHLVLRRNAQIALLALDGYRLF